MVSLLAGQSWHMYNDGFFGEGSGLDDELSDYVARATVRLSPYFNGEARVRLDREHLEPQLTEITMTAGLPVFSLYANYLQAEGETTIDDQFEDREELTFSASSRVSRYWTLIGGATWDLADDEETRSWYSGAIYDDECFTFQATISEDFTEDRDYEGGFEAMFRIVFKTLGEVQLGSSVNDDDD